MGYVLVADFKERLESEIELLEGGILLASDKTGISDRGLRRILGGKQQSVSDEVFDRIATAFGWEQWQYTVHNLKDVDGN
jgi:hypothetical protein